MWIEELANGKFKYVERYTEPWSGKQRKVCVTLNDNKRKTQKLAQEQLEKKIEQKLKVTSDKAFTFTELADKWLAVYIHTVKRSTYSNTAQKINRMKRECGNVLCERFTPSLFNNFFESLILKHGLMYESVKIYRNTLRQVLRYGMQSGYLEYNHQLLDGLVIPRINLSKKNDDKYLERDEFNTLIDNLQARGRYHFARFAKIQTATGMRFGELASLRFEDVDMENCTITISRTYDSSNALFTSPKNGKSRTIHVTDETIQLIKQQWIHSQTMRIKYRYTRNLDLIFITQQQNPLCYSQFNTLLGLCSPENKKVTSHYFRHTFITRMVEAGVEAKLIAEHVGHSNTEMVNRVYSHFSEKMNNDLKNAISRVEII